MKNDALKQINSFPEFDQLAEETVAFAKNNSQSPNDYTGEQDTDSIFYKVYNDICNRRAITYGSYFAERLKNEHGIIIPIQ